MNDIRQCCLTIAGSDSGGNAGVQADLRTFHAYALHGCTVFAALTAQNPLGVKAIHPVPADFVAAQLDAVLGTYAIAALKTGMLADPEAIEAISERLGALDRTAKIIDPVMVATSGAKLTPPDAVEAMKKLLLPLASLITPNIPEAQELSGIVISSQESLREAAKRIHGKFGSAVLIKGGHAAGNTAEAEDTLFDGTEFHFFSLPWIENPVSTHGTGCTLSAAIAAELATGRNMTDAVAGAKKYVHRAIAGSYFVGPDCGVLA